MKYVKDNEKGMHKQNYNNTMYYTTYITYTMHRR